MRVESLIELRPAPDAVSSYRSELDREWGRRWPMEHIWRLRREAGVSSGTAVANAPSS